jgi:hypothetical protein
MRVVHFSVEITAFYVIVTVFFCQINQKHVMHASEVTLFCYFNKHFLQCELSVCGFKGASCILKTLPHKNLNVVCPKDKGGTLN